MGTDNVHRNKQIKECLVTTEIQIKIFTTAIKVFQCQVSPRQLGLPQLL